MRYISTLILIAASCFVASPAHASPVPSAQLEAATWCDAASATRRTVLLIHGTGATPDEAWAWNYEKTLPAAGFGVCTVTLPDRAVRDFTVSAEYAAYAARYAYNRSGRKIAIMGHSQGGLMAVWIAKFWPDIAAHADDVIALAGNVHGTALANTLCVTGSCAPIAWQMAIGSHVTNAASNAPLPSAPSFTSIASRDDEIVYPQPYASTVDGGTTIMVQNVCPLRIVDHGLMLADAVVYRLVLDALNHDGPASARRIPSTTCLETTMPGIDPIGAVGFAKTLTALSVGLLNATEYVDHEPALPAYAEPYG